MKKFIFSAVAMIAFVGSSMASDIAEKQIVINEVIKVSNTYNLFVGPKENFCYRVAADALDSIASDIPMSDVEANNFYQTAFKICMKKTK